MHLKYTSRLNCAERSWANAFTVGLIINIANGDFVNWLSGNQGLSRVSYQELIATAILSGTYFRVALLLQL